ncbi:MAG: hypothetical protein HQK49_12005 [Oligoflexia bacterium]|nr:hypothetical protein [Oligoflexia bacterium]
MEILRVFTDTSVFGGCYDQEFSETSRKFFDKVLKKEIIVVISESVLD